LARERMMIKLARLLMIVGLLAVAIEFQPVLGVEVRPKAFLRALQDQGYGDVAVDYLNTLKVNNDLTADLRETWDLEMSKSLRIAAQDAYNIEEHDSLMRESEKYLTRFIEEKPERPEAFEARAIWANFAMEKALKELRASRSMADKRQQAKLLEQSRSALHESRIRLKQAEEKNQAELEAMPAPPKRPVKRAEKEAVARYQELKTNLLNYRFQNALIDYYLAQTYAPGSAERKKALQTAANAFDAVFQPNRMETAGLLAHMWHGKTMEELGDWQTALDIYDEVLVNEPEPGQVQSDAALEALFAQVEHFRLQILAIHKPEQFMEEADKWVQQYRKSKIRQTEGFQGIALDLAKAKLDAAGNANASEKSKLTASALTLLAEMSKVRSPYQQEAVLLRRQLVVSGGKGSKPGSFEEAVALAESAAVAEQWSEATGNYELALQLAEKEKIDDTQRKEVRDALVNVIFMRARSQFVAGKMEECLAGADKIVKGHKDSPSAPVAGSLAVAAALNLYNAAPAEKKNSALERLKKYAKLMEDTWPGRPEADDARMMLAQADLIQGKIDGALAVFEKINPRSDRYPSALLLAGETYWRRWLAEKEKPEAARNKSQMDADLDKAMRNLEDSVKLQRKKLAPGETLSRSLIESQLLLAEIKLSRGDAQEAAGILQPLVEAVRGSKPEDIDNVAVRIYVGAIRAQMAQDNLEAAVSSALLLADAGPDVQNVNGVLIETVKMLNDKRKQAEEAAAEASASGKPGAADEARGTLRSINALLDKLLSKVSSRKELSLPAAAYFADVCMASGMPDVAKTTYLRVADRAAKDPAYAKTSQKALMRVRAQLVDLLKETGDYEEAYKQVSQLVAANPRALDLLMTQGRILQSWSERDASRYEKAVTHWAKLRNTLQGMAKKPPEYFEATYNLAAALYGQAGRTPDKTQAAEKIKQAEQLLKSTLILSPNLSGPEIVDKYESLLKKINDRQKRL
jgi:hypothetical protein